MRRKQLVKEFRNLVDSFRFYGIRMTLKKVVIRLKKSVYPNDYLAYWRWIHKFEKKILTPSGRKFKFNPLISIIIPVYHTPEKILKECLDSNLRQSYPNFEVCIYNGSPESEIVTQMLAAYSQKDNRIKIHAGENKGISENTNKALKLANGEFIALMDHDDIIPSYALYEIVALINQKQVEGVPVDMIYSDEDKIDIAGVRYDPFFKPDWSPDYILSVMYTCHLSVYRKKIVDEIGGFRSEYDGSQDWDFVLRFTEKTNHIQHIPKILYHWRAIPGSLALDLVEKEYAHKRSEKLINETLKRRNIKAVAVQTPQKFTFYTKYDPIPAEKCTIIIPTRNHADMLKRCISSIYHYTPERNFEILIIDNGSTEKNILDLFNCYERENSEIKVLHEDIPFNFAKLNNLAVGKAKGRFLLFLNNDTEVITKDWLTQLMGQAANAHTGAVGAKLLYPDYTLQHSGAGIGIYSYHTAAHVFCGTPRKSTGYFFCLASHFNCSAVSAACLMVEKRKFESVGGFDERFAVNYQDVDFCLKLHEKGFFNVCMNEVELIHYESMTRKNITADLEGEIALFKSRWRNYIHHDPFYNDNFSKDFFDMRLPE